MKSLYCYNSVTNLREGSGPGYAALRKMYGWFNIAVTAKDRTENLRLPTRNALYHRCRIPAFRPVDFTYRDCCDRRAEQIWQLSAELSVPIHLMWSGGLDSTRMLISFLENFPKAELRDRVRVLTSPAGKMENQQFYHQHVLPNFELINSGLVPWMFDKKSILVTGEHNDQLFGADTYRTYYVLYRDLFNAPLDRTSVLAYMDTMISDKSVTNFLYDAAMRSADSYGIVLEKNSDWWWWWNFCFKWQNVNFRMLTLAAPECWQHIDDDFMGRHLLHFYDTEDFQLWSVNNPQIRYLSKWSDYKIHTRQEIYEFDRNENYFNTKSKKASLKTVFLQRTLAEAVDEDFRFYEKFDPADWYDPDNSIQHLD